MNETQSSLTSAELLAIFALLMLFLFGCSPAHQTAPAVTLPAHSDEAALPVAKAPIASSAALLLPDDWQATAARPFDEAIANSLDSLLSLVELPIPGAKQLLLVDPIIDGNSGIQSSATRRIETQPVYLVRKKYPHFSAPSLG